MRAEQRVDRGRLLGEQRGAVADDRRAVHLGSDDQRVIEGAEPGGGAEEQLRPNRAAADGVLEVAVLRADARGVREDAEVSGGFQPAVEADGVVPGVVVALAGRDVNARAEREREGLAVGADEAQVRAEAKVAHRRRARRRVRHSVEDTAVPVLKDGHRQIEPHPQAIPENERRAYVREDLVSDDAVTHRPVRRVDDERAVRAVHDDADRGTHVPAQVERLDGEPIAPALGRIERV